MDALIMFTFAAIIVCLLWFFFIGWVVCTAGMIVIAWWRGEDWRQVLEEMKGEW